MEISDSLRMQQPVYIFVPTVYTVVSSINAKRIQYTLIHQPVLFLSYGSIFRLLRQHIETKVVLFKQVCFKILHQ